MHLISQGTDAPMEVVRAMRGAVVVPGYKEQAELLDVLVLSGCRLKQVCPLAAHMQSAQSALMDG